MAIAELILVERNKSIATITINRPEKNNALNTQMMEDLPQIFKQLGDDRDTKVVILTGAGERAFSSGADIKELREATRDKESAETFWNRIEAVSAAIEACPKPVIARLRGYVLGAATPIALACDFRSADSELKIGIPAIRLGITLDRIAADRLASIVGKSFAKEILMFGMHLNAQTAFQRGLANWVFPPEDLVAETNKRAVHLLNQPSLVLGDIKNLYGPSPDYQDYAVGSWPGSHTSQEGVAAFLEKREPNFPDD